MPALRPWERRTAFPSIADTSPGIRTAAWVYSTKQRRNCSGSSRENASLKVPWEGMPLGRSRKPRNRSSLLLPDISAQTHESAPQITAQMAMAAMSATGAACPLYPGGLRVLEVVRNQRTPTLLHHSPSRHDVPESSPGHPALSLHIPEDAIALQSYRRSSASQQPGR